MMIYLDHNIILDILHKRDKSDEILNKVDLLKSQGHSFWYSPAHIEETANIKDDEKSVNETLDIIHRLTDDNEILPGVSSLYEIYTLIISAQKLNIELPNDLIYNLMRVYIGWLNNQYSNEDVKFRNVNEDPKLCYERVINQYSLSEWAVRNDVACIGIRNESSRETLFEYLQDSNAKSISKMDNEKIRRLFNIEPDMINRLKEYEIFKAPEVVQLMKALYGSIVGPINSETSFDIIQEKITLCMNLLEKISYHIDSENDFIKIRSRMNDVSHAIYATDTDVFVTGDKKFCLRLKAVYCHLDVNTLILRKEEFIDYKF